ncbi:unnamed protein product [Clonostachys solani]|uniref:CFEM domain-containing protein n=1 Tax=Clonostachys solani TaxID=160281 RepID=A0A9N9ZGF2_9HYPO|nr:unnamed protein product [Clonostachys solani]
MAFSTRRMIIELFIIVLGLVNVSRGEVNLISEISKFPACGISCFTSVMGNTSCPFTNSTCVCSDTAFIELAQICVVSKCQASDALKVAQVEAAACERTSRSRKHVLFLPLIADVPAWFCPWILLYSRILTMGRLELDDYMVLAIGAIYTPLLVLGKYTGYLAFGVDMWSLDYDTITKALKIFFVCESLYLVALALCKISLVCFYLRIFPNRKFRVAAFTVIALIIIPTLTLVFLQIFQCKPVQWAWLGWRLEYYRDRCSDVHLLTVLAAGFSIFQDALVITLPLPLLWNLKMARKEKFGIFVMFSLGIFITITSCIRLQYISRFGLSVNPTWDYTETIVWTGIELSVSIIVVCLPAMRKLTKRFIPWLASTISSGSYGKDTTTGSNSTRTRRDFHQIRDNRYHRSHERGNMGESQVELGEGIELETRGRQKDGFRAAVTRNSGSDEQLEGIMVVKTVSAVSGRGDGPF